MALMSEVDLVTVMRKKNGKNRKRNMLMKKLWFLKFLKNGTCINSVKRMLMDSLAVQTTTTITSFCTSCFNVNSLHFIFQLLYHKYSTIASLINACKNT